ncbi:DUF4238 domain-containing protein [Roseibium sp. RKSG952]|uniref:DUF4238 domain-containing protein n=1 Tax=Roseibium sp. RKSG952 TaxID=2529384 RepID=UPI0012BBBCB9|nr:DUF4238 domain-containing protein [Roseibium sp. RKSG952]MTH94818.1 DUF4238 domain-containing protein [Roseibium sp. RKSG952]
MSFVKYQHYLPRKHMSWFSYEDGKTSRWILADGRFEDCFNLENHGGQKHLYESDQMPRNHIETNILNPIENAFYEARDRTLRHKQVRSASDRAKIKQYAVAQFLRQQHLHKRISHLDDDLRLLAKEMGVEKIWGVDECPQSERRKRSSAVLADVLLNVEDHAKALKKHSVIFVSRPESDLLLPDSGVVVDYGGIDGPPKFGGLLSRDFSLWLPISPNSAIKIVRTKKFKPSQVMCGNQYEYFLQNLCLNASKFVIGHRNPLFEADLQNRSCFDPVAARCSMILQLYRVGVFDEMIFSFWKNFCSDIPQEFVRAWFYREKFIPSMNKLFNPDGRADADKLFFPL